MSGWFDKLLEELQRRQEEADARTEGRPCQRREPRERNVKPMSDARRSGSGGGQGKGGNGAESGGGGGGAGGRPLRPVADELPWRRYLLIGGGILGLLVLLGLLGGIVNLVTDVMWYDALGRRDVLQTRLWAQVVLFAIGFVAMLVQIGRASGRERG